MNKENKIKEILNEILEDKGEKHIETLNFDIRFKEDLYFDSFDLALLTTKIEDEFNIDIFESGIVATVGEVVSKLENE